MVSKRTIGAKKDKVKERSKKEKMASVGSPESSNSIDNDDKEIKFKDSNVLIQDRISIAVLLLLYTLLLLYIVI